MNRDFTLTWGLHSKELRSRVVAQMHMCNETRTQYWLHEKAVLITTLKNGDLHVYQNESYEGQDVYLLQEMGSEPWQDLVSIFVTAELLKKSNVHTLTVVVPIWKVGHHEAGTPYLPDRAGSQKLIADLLRSSGIDRLVTLTPTVDMLKSTFPIPVIQPDFAWKVIDGFGFSPDDHPLILAAEEEVLPFVQRIACRFHWEWGVCAEKHDGIFTNGDVYDRNVLLYTHHFTERIDRMAASFKQKHCRSVQCYAPWLDKPEQVPDHLSQISQLVTLEDCKYIAVNRLSCENILAEWILQDRRNQN